MIVELWITHLFLLSKNNNHKNYRGHFSYHHFYKMAMHCSKILKILADMQYTAIRTSLGAKKSAICSKLKVHKKSQLKTYFANDSKNTCYPPSSPKDPTEILTLNNSHTKIINQYHTTGHAKLSMTYANTAEQSR